MSRPWEKSDRIAQWKADQERFGKYGMPKKKYLEMKAKKKIDKKIHKSTAFQKGGKKWTKSDGYTYQYIYQNNKRLGIRRKPKGSKKWTQIKLLNDKSWNKIHYKGG